MPTGDLLDFDRKRLADKSQEREDQALTEHRYLFLNHLAIAKHLEGWGRRLEGRSPGGTDEDFVSALREVAAHLRQGDYLPDGLLYQETVEGGR